MVTFTDSAAHDRGQWQADDAEWGGPTARQAVALCTPSRRDTCEAPDARTADVGQFAGSAFYLCVVPSQRQARRSQQTAANSTYPEDNSDSLVVR